MRIKEVSKRPARLGVTLPIRREDIPISDDEYKRRFDNFLEEHGRNDPNLGFFGNWARYGRLEQELRLHLRRIYGRRTHTSGGPTTAASRSQEYDLSS